MTTGPNDTMPTVEAAKGRACKRLDGPLPRRHPLRRAAHVEKMKRKAVLRVIPDTGFMPIRNGRIETAVQHEFALLMVTHADKIANGSMNAQDLQHAAIRAVARTLPAPRMVFDWRQ